MKRNPYLQGAMVGLGLLFSFAWGYTHLVQPTASSVISYEPPTAYPDHTPIRPVPEAGDPLQNESETSPVFLPFGHVPLAFTEKPSHSADADAVTLDASDKPTERAEMARQDVASSSKIADEVDVNNAATAITQQADAATQGNGDSSAARSTTLSAEKQHVVTDTPASNQHEHAVDPWCAAVAAMERSGEQPKITRRQREITSQTPVALQIELFYKPISFDPDIVQAQALQGKPLEQVTQQITGEAEQKRTRDQSYELRSLMSTFGHLGAFAECERVLAFLLDDADGSVLLVGVLYNHAHVVIRLPGRNRVNLDSSA